MKLGRREVLKVGALSLVGSSATAADRSSMSLVAFGSCNKPSLPQPLWAWVRAQKPDAWMWLGDIVYADTEDIDRTRSLYREQKERPEYAALTKETRITGIWDDHDYGKNDAGREYPKRVESQAALLDFLGEPKDGPRRRRRGTYGSYEVGSGDRRVKVIMLDGRYYREKPGPRADTLGAEQWAWFERELRSSTAAVTVVASGYQILPEDHKNEKWANFPRARARLFELLKRTSTPGVVLVSGDRHFAELSRVEDPGIGYPLHELTSSGLTHSWYQHQELNRLRVGAPYTQLNFGVVRVDWQRREVSLEAHANGGSVPLKLAIGLDRLRRAP